MCSQGFIFNVPALIKKERAGGRSVGSSVPVVPASRGPRAPHPRSSDIGHGPWLRRNRAVGSICSRGRVASAGPPAAFCDKPPGVLLWVKAKHVCVAQLSKAHIAMVRLLLRTYTF